MRETMKEKQQTIEDVINEFDAALTDHLVQCQIAASFLWTASRRLADTNPTLSRLLVAVASDLDESSQKVFGDI
jgi:hypothetical protein